MPATARRSKSEAYEKGIREGRAMAARSRNVEPEEGEEEEEEMDMAMQPGHSRKRSAKGAKATKAPMDGAYGKKPMDAECGCSGKKGGKCDGNCGSMRKRGDSLSPLEYLDACELGIQDRSTTYIRARLDAAERLDLKCGKGSISEGEKCTKGAAQRVAPNKKTTRATGAKYGAARRRARKKQKGSNSLHSAATGWQHNVRSANRASLGLLAMSSGGPVGGAAARNVWADGFSSSGTYDI